MVVQRLSMTLLNILFPPVAVFIMTEEMGFDVMMSCLLFTLAIAPSHVHGFYLSCVYFHRMKKVKKGRYPGGPKPFISSPAILNGGASERELLRLKNDEKLKRTGSKSSQRSKRLSNSQRGSKRTATEVKPGQHIYDPTARVSRQWQ